MKKYDISGVWKFSSDTESTSVENVEFDSEITLPDTLSAAGIGGYSSEMNSGYLTDPFAHEGRAWFSRTVDIDFSADKIYTLVLERTRTSHVYINGKFVGSENTLCGVHRYDITDYVTPHFELTVMTDNLSCPTKGGHMTSPDTQTNWNGILGRMEITEESKAHISDISIVPNVDTMYLDVSFKLDTSSHITFSYGDRFEEDFFEAGENGIVLDADGLELWSESSPKVYTLRIETDSGNIYEITFGMRKFRAGEHHFEINGRKTFLRGKHDGMIFPLTGYAPTDKESWLKVMGTAKEYGINHYRFHTCCPPDAAFDAADELGIYMEPELPFWGTVQAPGEEGFNETEQEYLIREGFNIIAGFSHHPSFVMMSLGNELWGSRERLGEMIRRFREVNSDILYSSGSNNFQFCPAEIPEEDFFSGVRFDRDSLIRGSYAMCDAPQGFVQTEAPNTSHSYDKYFMSDNPSDSTETAEKEIEIQYGTGVKKVKAESTDGRYIPHKPVISHEVGQYVTYPDYKTLDKFTGVLKPRNFMLFKERLDNAHLGKYAERFFRDSGALASFCYKLEIEAARRSEYLAGYQLLDIQDFTGQGTACVGILDTFMEPKGIISKEDWLGFSGEKVLLASFDRFVLYDGDEFSADVILSNYSSKEPEEILVKVEFDDQINLISHSGITQGRNDLGRVRFTVRTDKARRVIFRLSSGDMVNTYEMYLFPKLRRHKDIFMSVMSDRTCGYKDITVTSETETALEVCESGGTALLITNRFDGIGGTFCTDFWCYPMFRQISESIGKPVPVGTLGLTVSDTHGFFRYMAGGTSSSPQWYSIISCSECAVLDGTDISPEARMIDNFERNHSLGIVFETRCGNGKLSVITADIRKLYESYEGAALFDGVLEYTASGSFSPSSFVTPEKLFAILGSPENKE